MLIDGVLQVVMTTIRQLLVVLHLSLQETKLTGEGL